METFYDVLSDIYVIILDRISQDVIISIIGSVVGYLIRRFLPFWFDDKSSKNKPTLHQPPSIPPSSIPPSPIPSSPIPPPPTPSSPISPSPISPHPTSIPHRHSSHQSSSHRGDEHTTDTKVVGDNTGMHNEHKYTANRYDNSGIDDGLTVDRSVVDTGVFGGAVEESRNDYTARFGATAADIPFIYRVLKESIQNGGVLKHLIDYIVMLRTQHDQYQRELRYWQQQYTDLLSHYQEIVRKREL